MWKLFENNQSVNLEGNRALAGGLIPKGQKSVKPHITIFINLLFLLEDPTWKLLGDNDTSTCLSERKQLWDVSLQGWA